MKLAPLARWGYFSRALVYLLMGYFAILLIVGSPEGHATDSKGALRHLLEQPMGNLLLAVLATGLFCYAIWRFAQGLFDLSHLGRSPKAIIHRMGFLGGGIAHCFLGVYAIKLIFDLRPNTQTEKFAAHELLTLPFGQTLTLLVALGILGFGIGQIIMGWKHKYLNQLNLPEKFKSWLLPICKFGFIARGFVFTIIGIFFIRAGLHYNSKEAGGIAKAWKAVRELPLGDFLLFIIAIGFIAFAVYGFTESKYQKQVS
jgi:hypothetical protein